MNYQYTTYTSNTQCDGKDGLLISSESNLKIHHIYNIKRYTNTAFVNY